MFHRRFSMLMPGAILLSAILAAACSQQESEPLEVLITEGQVHEEYAGGGRVVSYREPDAEYLAKFQPDVRMAAYMKDGWIDLRLRNSSSQPLRVSAKTLALVVPPGRKGGGPLHPADGEGVLAQFPDTVIQPKGAAQGRLKFLQLGDLTGCYLIFRPAYGESVRPSRCEIQMTVEEGRAPAAPPGGQTK